MEYTIHLGEDTLNELDKIVNGGGSEGGGGSSDFSTAEVSITSSNNEAKISGAFCSDGEGFPPITATTPSINGITTGTYKLILYKGKALINCSIAPTTISGNIEAFGPNNYMVTGDCGIEISGGIS